MIVHLNNNYIYDYPQKVLLFYKQNIQVESNLNYNSIDLKL